MKKIGNGAGRILYYVLFCLVILGLTWAPSPQITAAQADSAFDSAWDALTNVENLINDLPNSAFKKHNNRKVLLKKIDATIKKNPSDISWLIRVHDRLRAVTHSDEEDGNDTGK